MRPDHLELYRSGPLRWRWRRVSGNGRNVSNPGQSFATKTGAKRSARRYNPDVVDVVTVKDTDA